MHRHAAQGPAWITETRECASKPRHCANTSNPRIAVPGQRRRRVKFPRPALNFKFIRPGPAAGRRSWLALLAMARRAISPGSKARPRVEIAPSNVNNTQPPYAHTEIARPNTTGLREPARFLGMRSVRGVPATAVPPGSAPRRDGRGARARGWLQLALACTRTGHSQIKSRLRVNSAYAGPPARGISAKFPGLNTGSGMAASPSITTRGVALQPTTAIATLGRPNKSHHYKPPWPWNF